MRNDILDSTMTTLHLYPCILQIFFQWYQVGQYLFHHIVGALENHYPYFTQRTNALGKHDLSPLNKYTTTVQILAYVEVYDSMDKYIYIGITTVRKCLMNFVRGVESIFGDIYLRRSNVQDVQHFLFITMFVVSTKLI